MIGKSLQIKGEVIGCESLYIDGKIEGAINLPESQVTVGYPQVLANITAREVVNLGTVRGSCQCQRPCGHSQPRFVDQGSDDGAHHYWRWRLLQGRHRHQQVELVKDRRVLSVR
jgi:hypothetical protein